jgi:predicted DNA-binding protein
MGKEVKNPMYNVVSIRMSDKERRHLDTLVKRDNKNVSAVMREVLVKYIESDVIQLLKM